ncbi:32829_t:CDS:2, partial [Gigaspora margarita]
YIDVYFCVAIDFGHINCDSGMISRFIRGFENTITFHAYLLNQICHEWLNIIKNESEIIGEIITELDKQWKMIKNESESRNEKQFLERWLNTIENENRIKKQFLESDEISKNLPIILKKLSKTSYASKPYNTSEI